MTGAPAAPATLHPTILEGCTEVRRRPHRDAWGLFLKTYHEATFQALGLGTAWREEFISISSEGATYQMSPRLS